MTDSLEEDRIFARFELAAGRIPHSESIRSILELAEVDQTVFLVYHFGHHGSIWGWLADPTGAISSEMVDALKRIGAVETATLLRRAMDCFPGGVPPESDEERGLLMYESFSPELQARIDELSMCYNAENGTLFKLLSKYLESEEGPAWFEARSKNDSEPE